MKRNPYILLGIPFGSSRDVAQAAFARRAKRLRRKKDGADRLTDLTWALNQIDEVLRSPEQAVDVYRVPADEGALVPRGEGILNPAARVLEPQHELTDTHRIEAIAEAAAQSLSVLAHDVAARVALPER